MNLANKFSYNNEVIMERKQAFTLAEVLITLGIIGVVASLTIPALVGKHQKKVTAIRLKHFTSVWRNAYTYAVNENGNSLAGNPEAANPDEMLEYYKMNWGKMIKTIELEKTNYGIIGALANGSGFYIYRSDANNADYLIFCPSYKYCKEFSKTVSSFVGEYLPDGKNTFNLYVDGTMPIYNWDGTREFLLNKCASNAKGYCSKLIEYDEWEIKDDYPAW